MSNKGTGSDPSSKVSSSAIDQPTSLQFALVAGSSRYMASSVVLRFGGLHRYPWSQEISRASYITLKHQHTASNSKEAIPIKKCEGWICELFSSKNALQQCMEVSLLAQLATDDEEYIIRQRVGHVPGHLPLTPGDS